MILRAVLFSLPPLSPPHTHSTVIHCISLSLLLLSVWFLKIQTTKFPQKSVWFLKIQTNKFPQKSVWVLKIQTDKFPQKSVWFLKFQTNKFPQYISPCYALLLVGNLSQNQAKKNPLNQMREGNHWDADFGNCTAMCCFNWIEYAIYLFFNLYIHINKQTFAAENRAMIYGYGYGYGAKNRAMIYGYGAAG